MYQGSKLVLGFALVAFVAACAAPAPEPEPVFVTEPVVMEIPQQKY
jgi:hypothetical protein